MYKLAKEYYHANGNLLIPASFTVNGILLGSWLQNQRQYYKHHKGITQKHIDKLNEIGMVWDVLECQWNIGFDHFKKAIFKNHNSRVKYIYVDEDGYKTGSWIQTQVEQYMAGTLPQHRYKKLIDANFFKIQKITR